MVFFVLLDGEEEEVAFGFSWGVVWEEVVAFVCTCPIRTMARDGPAELEAASTWIAAALVLAVAGAEAAEGALRVVWVSSTTMAMTHPSRAVLATDTAMLIEEPMLWGALAEVAVLAKAALD